MLIYADNIIYYHINYNIRYAVLEDLFLESQTGAQGLLTWELSVNSIFFGALHSPFICCQYIFTGNDHELSCSFRQDSL